MDEDKEVKVNDTTVAVRTSARGVFDGAFTRDGENSQGKGAVFLLRRGSAAAVKRKRASA